MTCAVDGQALTDRFRQGSHALEIEDVGGLAAHTAGDPARLELLAYRWCNGSKGAPVAAGPRLQQRRGDSRSVVLASLPEKALAGVDYPGTRLGIFE